MAETSPKPAALSPTFTLVEGQLQHLTDHERDILQSRLILYSVFDVFHEARTPRLPLPTGISPTRQSGDNCDASQPCTASVAVQPTQQPVTPREVTVGVVAGKTTIEKKAAIVAEIIDEIRRGSTQSAACKKAGICHTTFQDWKRSLPGYPKPAPVAVAVTSLDSIYGVGGTRPLSAPSTADVKNEPRPNPLFTINDKPRELPPAVSLETVVAQTSNMITIERKAYEQLREENTRLRNLVLDALLGKPITLNSQ